jgi:3'(2'), 5'-bisphosphate nucleotidase
MYIHLGKEYNLLSINVKIPGSFSYMIDPQLLIDVLQIAKEAGSIIMGHYHSDQQAMAKSDASPLTIADLESNNFIRSKLSALNPSIPIISEESIPDTYEERQSWKTFWLVDPLDGTKEFIKKSGQFTVNIALITNGSPVLGVIEVPFLNEVYYASNNEAYHVTRGNGMPPTRLHVRALDPDNIAIVASRDHSGAAVQALCNLLPKATLKSMGSSLKFCLVAAGLADIYLRDIPTMEWDTAAAHAILQASGGDIYTLDGNVLSYNKESLRNPHIVSVGTDRTYWFERIDELA